MARPYRIIPELTPQDIERFRSKVNKSPGQGPEGTCWEWQGGRDTNGYGCFYIHSEHYGANRVAYKLHTGVDPKANQACHSCDNPPCCNPVHLWPGTSAENTADRDRKGRQAKGARSGSRLHPERLSRGEQHYKVRLTAAQVQEVRALHAQGANLADLARQLHVTSGCIDGIAFGKTWKQLPIMPPETLTLKDNPHVPDRGSAHWNSRVTEDIVRTIRADYAAGRANQYELAERYNISRPAIGMIIRRINWKHVT